MKKEKKVFFYNTLTQLFNKQRLFESLVAPEERNWAFLIYSFDSEELQTRPYPAESDYTATCSVLHKKGKCFIRFNKLELYGPLKVKYAELGLKKH